MRRFVVAAGLVLTVGLLTVPSGTTAGGPNFAAPPSVLVQYGHLESLALSAGKYRMRFDPALWLEGLTANRAAIEDGVIASGEAVPNDHYIRDENHKLLSYLVAPNARVTVITNPASGLRSTRVTVSELAAITKGKNPNGRKLYGAGLGYWIRVTGDTVRALDQQYQP